jgi:uncharacterized RDD family membrane protein YckC
MNDSTLISIGPTPAGPMRRMGAMLYDALLLIAVLMAVTALFLVATAGRGPDSNITLLYIYRLLLLATAAAFFGLFWTRKGCTLGMQAWRLQIETSDARLPTWRDVALRLLSAVLPWSPALLAFGVAAQSGRRSIWMVGYALLAVGVLNYIAAYWAADKRALHERWLNTRIVKRK